MTDHETASDGALLEAFARGDEASFDELIRRHGSMVYGVCRRLLADHHEAQDVTQAVFLTLARKGSWSLRNSDLGGWLHNVGRCLAINTLKARDRRNRREEEVMRLAELGTQAPTQNETLTAELDAGIARLPRRYRRPLILFHLEERSLEQIARALRLNVKTVGTRLIRGRETLRRDLVRRGVAVGSAGALTTLLSAEAGAAVLPATFVSATVKAASLAAAGNLAAGVGTGVVSAKVAAMTKGAINMLFLSSVKTAAMVTAACVVVVGGGALVAGTMVAAPGEGLKTSETPGTNETQTAAEERRDGIETIPTVMVNAGTSWVVGALRPDGTVDVRMGGMADAPWADIQLASQVRNFVINKRVYDQTKSGKVGPLAVTDEMATRMFALSPPPAEKAVAPTKEGEVPLPRGWDFPTEKWQLARPPDEVSSNAFTAVELWLRSTPEVRATQTEALRQKVQLAVAGPAAKCTEAFRTHAKAVAGTLTADQRDEFAKWAAAYDPRKPRGSSTYLLPEWRGDKIIEGQRIIAKQGHLTLEMAQGASMSPNSACRQWGGYAYPPRFSYSQRRQEGVRPDFLAGDATLTIDLLIPAATNFDVRNSVAVRDLQNAIDRGAKLADFGLTEEQISVFTNLHKQIKELRVGQSDSHIGVTTNEVKALKALVQDVVAVRPTRPEAEAALLGAMAKISDANTRNHVVYMELLNKMTAVLKPENMILLKKVQFPPLPPPPVKSPAAPPPATKP